MSKATIAMCLATTGFGSKTQGDQGAESSHQRPASPMEINILDGSWDEWDDAEIPNLLSGFFFGGPCDHDDRPSGNL